MTSKAKVILLIPPFWASLFDIVITIVHQPPEYWSGDLTTANEGNPIGALFMSHHVAGLFLISALWLLLIGVLGYYLPRRVSRVFLLFVLITHSFGASTWLSGRYGFWYAMLFILANSVLFYRAQDAVENEAKDKSC